jgi:hypothetical protein
MPEQHRQNAGDAEDERKSEEVPLLAEEIDVCIAKELHRLFCPLCIYCVLYFRRTILTPRTKPFIQGLKPASLADLGGTAGVVHDPETLAGAIGSPHPKSCSYPKTIFLPQTISKSIPKC